jgi:glycosyltransferase (activator-dependent family)
MRVLFNTLAVRAHLYSMVPLAWALRAAGHEVCVASQPDLADTISAAGLPAVAVGEPLHLAAAIEQAGSSKFSSGQFQSLSQGMARDYPGEVTWEHALGEFTTSVAHYEYFSNVSVTDDLVRFARLWKPDLVVWDCLTYSGPIAARACGAAHARLLFTFDYIGRMRADFLNLVGEQPAEWQEDPMTEWLSAKLSRYDCEFAEEMVTGQWTIDAGPEWMRLPVDLDYLTMRYVPYNGSVQVPSWVHEPPVRPRVAFTLGVSGREVVGAKEAVTADVLAALAALDIELIATLTEDQLGPLPALPDNVRVVDFVPLDELLATCAAIIHHGGSGTTCNAITRGVPQLIIPANMWQEFDLADRLTERGAALTTRPADLTPTGLRNQLHRLLTDSSFRTNAAEIQKEAKAGPGPNDLVAALEERTARHRT